MSDEWLNVDASIDQGEPKATAHTLKAIADTLRHAPDGKRYSMEITVTEHNDN